MMALFLGSLMELSTYTLNKILIPAVIIWFNGCLRARHPGPHDNTGIIEGRPVERENLVEE